MAKLDDTDWAILGLLQRDGRISNKELAKRVGLAASSCSERVKKLEQRGVIASYRAVINLPSLGARFDAWAEVCFDTLEVVEAFVAFSRTSAAIISAHRLAQPNTLLVHVVAPSVDAWRDLLSAAEREGFRFASVRLSIVTECVKAPGSGTTPLVRLVASKQHMSVAASSHAQAGAE